MNESMGAGSNSSMYRALLLGNEIGNGLSAYKYKACPSNWSLTEFYEEESFPARIFNPKLFHGRRNGILEATKPPMSEGSPFYMIQFIIAVNQPIVIHNDENRYLHIKQQIMERFGKAIPLDRCKVLCCTQNTKA